MTKNKNIHQHSHHFRTHRIQQFSIHSQEIICYLRELSCNISFNHVSNDSSRTASMLLNPEIPRFFLKTVIQRQFRRAVSWCYLYVYCIVLSQGLSLYRSGTDNSKWFVCKVFLQIKWKFNLYNTLYFELCTKLWIRTDFGLKRRIRNYFGLKLRFRSCRECQKYTRN